MKYLIFLALSLAGCASDETLSGYAPDEVPFALTEWNGATYDGDVHISFGADGVVGGMGPCNRYFARLTAPYPWFALDGIGATEMACPALSEETAYFEALEATTQAEINGTTLILSNEAGQMLVFRAR